MIIDECFVKFFGIGVPNNPFKCCASSCGEYCGSSNCASGPGGYTSCCPKGINETVKCGISGQYAPCTIGIDDM